jgi:hypothetical protein
MQGIKTIAGNIGANMLGGQLDKLQRPQMFGIHSLLTANPTGEWHVTVGNPFNPTMMIGNLIMENASWGMEGPFTIDDIPSYITLEIKLKHAMPRDKYSIQRMFNYGGTRFYGSNIDFENKSYYRNRSLHGNGGKLTPPAKIAENSASIGQSDSSTAAVVRSRYQSFEAGYASA